MGSFHLWMSASWLEGKKNGFSVAGAITAEQSLEILRSVFGLTVEVVNEVLQLLLCLHCFVQGVNSVFMGGGTYQGL